jgi:DNA polymerase (family 10)
MQNAAIAAIFDDIAAYLEVAGENVFKVRAYRRAAEAVATYPSPIEDAAEAGTLQDIGGLGTATAAKTREYLATGKVQELERLRERYPIGLLDLLRVPNLGPKKVTQLYQERNISSVEELVAALEEGRLEGLAGFGPKTLENIRRGIARLAQMTKRLPLGDARVVAANLVRAISTMSAVHRVEIAGSLRRGCDTVGNINLLAETDDAATVIQEFVALPFVLQVVEQIAEYATVRMRPGIDVQLRCASPDTFGTELLHSTGSAEHVTAAARCAAEFGLALQADGLFRGGTRVAGGREEDIYTVLEVPFIMPELREGRGEWEAARAGALPNLVQVTDIQGDLHAHSTWSDGVASIRQMVAAARERGYSYHAVTDHSKALAMANGLNATRLREQAKEIAEVQAEFPDMKILRGVECDILRDGRLDLDDDILHELDIVIASVHSAFNLDEAAQTARMIRAISHPAVDIVAHPTGRVLGVRPGYEVNVNALIEAATRHGDGSGNQCQRTSRLSDIHARAARDSGVLLSIDSDAHSHPHVPQR